MNPYEVLGVSYESDDASIRGAYLELVKKFTPEMHPDKFEEINRAYITLKDEKSRLEYYLFNEDTWIKSPFEALIASFSMSSNKRRPPGFARLKEYLRKCSTQ